MNNEELKSTLKAMLYAELEAMHFYQQASSCLQDDSAAFHFSLLAQEELEHARTFHELYPGNDLPDLETIFSNLTKEQGFLQSIDADLIGNLDEKQALELAIQMEAGVADRLRTILKQIQSPAARAVIEKNLESTNGHQELIEQEFQRLYPTEELPVK